ncbi:NmrA family NAD(P)-binding protein [SAR92 clade bacterium H921]|nr:NmrA family NAD(P)-binding protein [SAR92 clade bacterium H921]
MPEDIKKVLVLGASGDQGLPLIAALLDLGVTPVAGVRRLDAMKDSVYPDIPVVTADIMDQSSLEAAFAQVDSVAMHLPFVFDEALAAEFGRNIGAAAAATGLKKIVFNTSCYVADTDLGISAHDGRRRIEEALRDCGVDYVILRPAVFMDNMIRVWCKPTIVHKDTFVYPAKEDLKVSWICLDDLARLSAYAAVTPELRNKTIPVGGPEALTGFQVAEKISTASGRTVQFNSIAPTTFAQNMSELVTGSRDIEPKSIYNGMASFYSWYNAQPQSPLDIDPQSFADLLPVKLTSYEQWAARQDWSRV